MARIPRPASARGSSHSIPAQESGNATYLLFEMCREVARRNCDRNGRQTYRARGRLTGDHGE